MAAAANPFPGMNPYLEQRWGDVHSSLVLYGRDMIQGQLPDDLRARAQERVFIESSIATGGRARAFEPDVYAFERRPPGSMTSPENASAGVAILESDEPLLIDVPDFEVTESYLEIIDTRSGGRVVTMIEVVSRSNKTAGPGRELYLQKQTDARAGGANLVEVDLLRGGNSVSLARPEIVPRSHQSPYHVSVWRACKPLKLEYYRAPLRQRLPKIRIPLRPTDADAVLDLQALVNLAYERGRYDDIDYAQPLQPALAADDAAWAEALLLEAGVR